MKEAGNTAYRYRVPVMLSWNLKGLKEEWLDRLDTCHFT